MKLITYILFFGLFIFYSCGNETEQSSYKREKSVAKINKSKPYAIEIARERSVYQAENIVERTREMDIESYLKPISDTIKGGDWYLVLAGAKKDSAEAETYKKELEEKYNLKNLETINHHKLNLSTKFSQNVDIRNVNEVRKISANTPLVPEYIYDVIKKFPKSNSFYIENLFVINSPKDKSEKTKFASVKNLQTDFPRGISKNILFEKALCISEAIYKDNIYGDNVTLDIIKLKPNHNIIAQVNTAGFGNFSRKKNAQLKIASYFADLILDTDKYSFEEKLEISLTSPFTSFYGYKVTIEVSNKTRRTYVVLVDENLEYVVFSQSTDKSERDLIKFLEEIGEGDGMMAYDEFYNTFYTLPDKLDGNDLFICFYLHKLDWSYAREKGYTAWSKKMVGHWTANGIYYHPTKGEWIYSLFDLLRKDKVDYIYNELYAGEVGSNKSSIDVYGNRGFYINVDYYFNRTREVNFPIKRYVHAVSSNSYSFGKYDLLNRAQIFQFDKGGYEVVANAGEESKENDEFGLPEIN